MTAPGLLVGVDVGGTFTDLVCFDPSRSTCVVAKVLSTPDDRAAGVMEALGHAGAAAGRLSLFVHGTTIATNTPIERKNATCPGYLRGRSCTAGLDAKPKGYPQVPGTKPCRTSGSGS